MFKRSLGNARLWFGVVWYGVVWCRLESGVVWYGMVVYELKASLGHPHAKPTLPRLPKSMIDILLLQAYQASGAMLQLWRVTARSVAAPKNNNFPGLWEAHHFL